MPKMVKAALSDRAAWEKAGVRLPRYDVAAAAERTIAEPVWLHFGAGNIFRGFIARLQNTLLSEGAADRGVIAAETFDFEIVDRIYEPYDDLAMIVDLGADGSLGCEISASVAQALRADRAEDMQRLQEIFAAPSLQMVSFTITEKGYALRGLDGEYTKLVREDMANRPEKARHAMSVVCALTLHRFRNGAAPLALVSVDNCSRNGEKLMSSVLEIARAWVENGFAERTFLDYLTDESRVSFPWSMIDKITPRPAESVERRLAELGIEDMQPVTTSRGTFIAPFVNAEIPQYLVLEDSFPNGRPPLERAGVYMTDRETVGKTERMKVCTCLNPLHTALAVFGCLLGYDRIAAEMKDPQLAELVRRIGYDEGMPVVTDPGIIRPEAFLCEVLTERLPNPFMPDMPQRIATDSSQKIPIRFGETIKAYAASPDLDVRSLNCIPLAIAGWLRYLTGVDDELCPMPISSDPMLEELQEQLAGIEPGKPESCRGRLGGILSNEKLFAVDLCACGLADKIEDMLSEMLGGRGAVRAALVKYLA